MINQADPRQTELPGEVQPSSAPLAATSSTLSPLWWGGAAVLAGGAAAALGLLTYALQVEPLDIRLERLTVRLPGAAGRLPQGGLRILQLSDSHFHGGKYNRRELAKIERVRALTAGLDYDLLFHTGDFIHFDSGLENVLRLLNAVPRPRLGSFGVFGNHDYTHYAMQEALPRMWRTFQAAERMRDPQRGPLARIAAAATRGPRYLRYVRNTPLDGRRTGGNNTDRLTTALAQWGMTLLHNQGFHLVRPELGLDVYLAGVDDVIEGRPRLGDSVCDIPDHAPLILLSHNPDIIASPQLPRVDLVLSGHTHGGQIRVPFWGPAHTQVEFVPRQHVSGFFRHGRTQVYITRGMGEGIPLRFRARPQITLIEVTT
ncbi:metallophosphoesterase [Caldilinea sp.]|uniref:metallophosphoesterase n=1 Tax=Caldilinea sp. TaxID=2293560 RepID=UPI002C676498|nr:metallophosphoesterase [Caldilinea sp.]